MEFFNRIITHYGWEGTALAGVLLVMFGIQLYYYLFVYGRIPKYKDTRRPEILSETPPVSVVIPLFSEDYAFVEEILPLIVAQEYPDFEVVIVYVGRDTDFYDDLVRIKQSFPQITATKIELNPRFPISPKMARRPNPPGTRIPFTSPSTSSTLSTFNSSESTHLMSIVACSGIPPCFKASTTEM